MTGNNDKFRAVVLAALMVFSVFAGTVAFTGSAAAAASNLDLGNGDGTGVAIDQGNALSDVETDIGTAGNNVHVWIDLDDDGIYDSGEPSASNTSSSGVTSNIQLPDLSTSGVAPGTYDVSATENASLTAGKTSENTTTNLVVGRSGAPELSSAVHYNDAGDEGTGVEVVFNEPVTIDGDDVTLYEDGAQAAQASAATNVTRVFLSTSDVLTGELDLTLSSEIVDAQGTNLTSGDQGNNSVTFAPVSVKYGDDKNAYKGGNVAIIANSTAGLDSDVTITGEGDYFFEGSTGVNSEVFVFNTANRNLGDYNISIAGSDDADTTVTVRNLGLGVSIDSLNVSTDDTIEGDISANAGNRDVEITLLDSNGDEINTTTATTNGDGSYSFSFSTATADGGNPLETGDYTVEVTDQFSGITVESSTITVSEQADVDANFASNSISDEQGDIVPITFSLTETDTATVSFGSTESGVLANATVTDDNDDGQVTLYMNTYNFVDGNANIFSLDSDSDDVLENQSQPQGNLGNLIDDGTYDLRVHAGATSVTPTSSSDDVATVTLSERNTTTLRTWTAPDGTSVSDLEDVNEELSEGTITQDTSIANGDVVVHQLVATGFEGALNARSDDTVGSQFFNNMGTFYDLTVEQASPGANQNAKPLELNQSNTQVIADGENDTYFVIFDTDQVSYNTTATGLIGDDTELEATFTVINDDTSTVPDYTPEVLDDDENETQSVTYDVVEPTVSVSTPYNVSQASGQTISGTSSLAPTTELTLRVRSQSGVSPSFLKTASPEVQPDGTWNATFDFSGQSVGDTYDIVINGPNADRVTEEGTVVEAMMTDTATATPEPSTDTATPEPDTATATPEPDTATATPEPDTATPTSTPTSTPGFGIVVALTALIAAALLAIRRD